MSGVLDYSKWDRLAADLSDTSDNEEESSQPKVTSLAQGGSVTIGPDGPSIVTASSVGALKKNKNEERSDTRNGGVTKEGFRWSQSENEVVIKVPIGEDLKARDVKMTLGVDEDMRRVLTLLDQARGLDVFKGVLRYSVKDNEDKDEDPFDWEIKRDSYNTDNDDGLLAEPQRHIHITMAKKSPIPNAVHWWSHVFEGDAEIDVTSISDRRQGKGPSLSSSSSSSSSSASFSKNWEEANRMFRENRQKQEKVFIDV